MFEQHPVPQQISSYQFRLVGDMTLKQFFQLAAGAVIGLIVYSLPLPGFFKWPLIVLAVVSGAAFAFLPIQDRPLEQWLVAFFRSIYAPTIFVWKKSAEPVNYFAADSQAIAPPVSEPEPTDIPHDVAVHNMDTNEKDFLARVSTMFGGHTPAQQTAPVPVSGTVPAPAPEPAPKEELGVPDQTPVAIEHQEPLDEQKPSVPVAEPTQTLNVPSTLSGTINVGTTQQAQFSPEAAPPTPPSLPNLIVGQVMDSKGKIVEGAILEIADSDGRPVRALKSNKAGHFMIVTPLPNGQYVITAEREGLEFEPITVAALGAIIAPIAVKSKDALPEPEPARATWSMDAASITS